MKTLNHRIGLSWRASRIVGLFGLWKRERKTIKPSRCWMAGWLKCSIRTCQTVLDELYSGGWVSRIRRYRKSSVYTLCRPIETKDCTADCTAVVKPENRRLERLVQYSPLVIFRDVWRRFAPHQPKKEEVLPDLAKMAELMVAGMSYDDARAASL